MDQTQTSSAGEQIIHLLPYLAIICIAGYVLGFAVKKLMILLG